MTEPAFLFTDPFVGRGNEIKGRGGIVDSLAERLPEQLVALNGLHENVLVPQGDLRPYADALRAATPQQVEDARHLIIQALDRVEQALRSRTHSTDKLSRQVHLQHLPAGVTERLSYPARALDGIGAVRIVAEEIRTLAGPSLDFFLDRPTSWKSGRMVAELAEAYAEGAVVLMAIAHGTGRPEDRAFAEAYGRDQEAFAERVERFRNGVGEVYAEKVHAVLPSKSEIDKAAAARAPGFGGCPRLVSGQVRKVIDELGGHDEGFRTHFGRRMQRYGNSPSEQFAPEPAPLSPGKAEALKVGAADVLDAYQALNHVPGFTGYVRQLICALETNTLGSLREAGLALSLREVMDAARPALGLAPAGERRTLVFRPAEGDDNVLVGRFSDATDDTRVALLFKRDRARPGREGVFLAFVEPDVLESGVPDENALHGREVGLAYSTHFMSVPQVRDWLSGTSRDAHLPDWAAVDGIGYDREPEPATPSAGMRP